jgi:hypothetical protein
VAVKCERLRAEDLTELSLGTSVQEASSGFEKGPVPFNFFSFTASADLALSLLARHTSALHIFTWPLDNRGSSTSLLKPRSTTPSVNFRTTSNLYPS